jgi:hypothetical protein
LLADVQEPFVVRVRELFEELEAFAKVEESALERRASLNLL